MTEVATHPLPPQVAALLDRDWPMLVGGALAAARSGATYTRTSPYTETAIAEVPDGDAADVDAAVQAAHAARAGWRATPPAERARLVCALADAIEAHGEELALLDTADAGSPISNSRADVAAGVASLRMFAGQVLELKGSTIPGPGGLHVTVREPVGVVARIVPYNHPLMFACKVAAPLVAGNPTILKPPEVAPLSAMRMAELAAGIFPPGVLSVVVGDGPTVPDALVRHELVRRIGFIGSEATGRAIQRAAAETGVKDVTLELGGKNAMVVFADADLDAAADGAVAGMNFTWSGQSCGSNSRLLVQHEVHDELVRRVVERIERRRIGDPFDEATEQGTMINRAQYEKSLSYIDIARAGGAQVVTGGGRPPGQDRGLFVAPTVFTGVAPDSRIAQEEVFGPLLSVIGFDGEAEAVEIANGVRYGLTASVWTRDVSRAHRVVDALEAGFTWINGSSRHFPNVPFGGMKGSGIGREESLEELLGYTELKAVNVMY
ncbi:aldehyde dehydrogenase family protein [Pseudonocardia sp. C8]|uniref:aldehyde dehydrogenase family protein n=1 Tax=Pseudonocardia sp. C8 TaxID=2762759 RepID=UPI0016432295|nr:aldehyde dehydrogenase family protein [Pseudonocardia sp. C8]MBC3191944.1 aldehyde dehydrogenase family protein [Pseudonocardia sp. C8]